MYHPLNHLGSSQDETNCKVPGSGGQGHEYRNLGDLATTKQDKTDYFFHHFYS